MCSPESMIASSPGTGGRILVQSCRPLKRRKRGRRKPLRHPEPRPRPTPWSQLRATINSSTTRGTASSIRQKIRRFRSMPYSHSRSTIVLVHKDPFDPLLALLVIVDSRTEMIEHDPLPLSKSVVKHRSVVDATFRFGVAGASPVGMPRLSVRRPITPFLHRVMPARLDCTAAEPTRDGHAPQS